MKEKVKRNKRFYEDYKKGMSRSALMRKYKLSYGRVDMLIKRFKQHEKI
jgi:Mor family transcriptional regulator